MSKEMFKNGIKIGRTSNFIGNFRAVLFCPEHLAIVKNDPSERRAFLDHAISQIDRSYLSALMEHKRLLEQRNALLKSENETKESFWMTLDILSERLAVCAAAILSSKPIAEAIRRALLLSSSSLRESRESSIF